MVEFVEFLQFIRSYLVEKTLFFSRLFEQAKNVLVSVLIAKRGRYSSSFLNISLFFIIAAAVVLGPIISENNPFSPLFSRAYQSENQSLVISYNPSDSGLSTVISKKPRDTIYDYKVVSGDTLESIARKFGISIDTIKWANNLKSDTIKPGENLKIPPVTGVVHKVTSGETVYSVAKKYKTVAQNIINFPFNDYADLDAFSLRVGQTLFVPDGVIEAEQPRYANLSPSYAQANAGVRGNSSFIWPTTGLITQYSTWYHTALDIANNALPAVLSSDTGTVTFSGCLQWGYGCHVVVDHGNGFQTLYAHMSSISVSAGQVVSQGQQIGVMGSTGRSTGPHLHFEIRSGGQPQDPLPYLR